MTDSSNRSEETLSWLESLSQSADPPPWTSWIEGRDQLAGDSFIMVGTDDERSEDVYVSRDAGPALAVELDVIAAARTYLPLLISEVRRLRARGTQL